MFSFFPPTLSEGSSFFSSLTELFLFSTIYFTHFSSDITQVFHFFTVSTISTTIYLFTFFICIIHLTKPGILRYTIAMQLTVLQENLQGGLSSVMRAISSRPQLPVLSNVLLDAHKGGLFVAGTDLEMGVLVAVGAKIEKTGRVTVPARMFSEFISSLPAGTLTLSLQQETIRVKADSYSAEFQTIPADEFPALPTLSSVSKGFSFPFPSFKEACERVLYSAARDSMRPVLTGLLFDIGTKRSQLVATDGFRLSVQQVDGVTGEPPASPLIVPSRAVSEILRVSGDGEVRFSVIEKQNQVVFVVGDTLIVTQLLDGTYPDYQKIIPSSFSTEASVLREELLEAVMVSQVFARDNSNVLQWEIRGSTLRMQSESPEQGKNTSDVSITLTGKPGSIAFNGRFLQDFLQASSAERVWFGMNERLSPGAFREEGNDSFLYIVMPINL